MQWLAGIGGGWLIAAVLWDAFETIVLPRRVSRRVRLTRLFYRATWRPYRSAARWVRAGKRREAYLSFFGPLSILLLLTLWAAALIAGFALLQYANGSDVQVARGAGRFGTDLYLSGTTFFTLGLGDVAPLGTVARLLTVFESGLGFAFLAIVIGYFPVLYQAFSRREVNISLLDARAGSPPSTGVLLLRYQGPSGTTALQQLLHEWERWAAEVLETHLSYPLLAYFRSQHANQSWIAALTTVLDTSALMMLSLEDACARQARLTFAIARHAAVDLAQVFGTPPDVPSDRLPPEQLDRLRDLVAGLDLPLTLSPTVVERLQEVRRNYEPYMSALARYLLHPLPTWLSDMPRRDNWQAKPWGQEPVPDTDEET
jgi:Ion channel